MTVTEIEEVTGSFRWVVAPNRGKGSLRINGIVYSFEYGVDSAFVKLGNYRIYKSPDGRLSCNCPDYRYRRSATQKGCKHCAAVRAAIAQLEASN